MNKICVNIYQETKRIEAVHKESLFFHYTVPIHKSGP